MRSRAFSRRHVLSLAAGAAALGVAGAGRATDIRWRGPVLGGEASARLRHPDPRAAERMLTRCLDEVARLEAIFSLYRPDSELSRLNRAGRVAQASLDLRAVLGLAQHIGAVTDGRFDVTVQPLFRLFARSGPRGPGPAAFASANDLVSYGDIDVSGGGVGFLRHGMAATLNGIAQGYIADRVADMLRNEGYDDVLLQLGETVALSPPGDAGWRLRTASSAGAAAFRLTNGAAATSRGAALSFANGRDHIFDPRGGPAADRFASATVIADRAAHADALSTGLIHLPERAVPRALRRAGAARAILVRQDGSVARVAREGGAA